MPLYEFRCAKCREISSVRVSIADRPQSIPCSHCGSQETRQIVSQPNIVLSGKSKVERLDPKYDKMIDSAIAKNPDSDPDRLLRRMRDPATGTPDD